MLYLGNQASSAQRANRLILLPRKIEKLQNLQVLSLVNQRIQVEGTDPLNLPKLVHLELFGTGYDAYPTVFCIPSVEQLVINGLTQPLPAQFSSMRRLTTLFLNECRIQSSLQRLAPMKHLRELNLPDSDITTLPSFAAGWTKLTRLWIDNTPLLEKLPPEATKLDGQELVRYILKMQSSSQ